MECQHVLFNKQEGIATLTLNRPERMNAYTNELGEEFLSVLKQVKEDNRIKVLIVTGAGRGFCAGVDLQEANQAIEHRKNGNTEWHDRLIRWITTAPKLMIDLNKPIIAAINGPAIGLGCTISLACDIRIASETARLALSFGRVSLVPEFGSTFILPRIVGLSKAIELIFTNKVLNAVEAKDAGLVNEVVPAEKLMEIVSERASMLAQSSSLAISLAKQGLYNGAKGDIDSQLWWEGQALQACFESTDHVEGVRAFLEKREPQFQ